ncbi:MAG: mechanosensitive ion channel family protein [Myxococcota bacterium]
MEMSSNSFEPFIAYATSALGALVVLILALILAGVFARMVIRASDRGGLDPTLAKFFSNIVRYAVIALGVISALSYFGVETTSFAAVLGATGLAVGLALQGTLGNVAAGVMLIIFRPFKVGDYVIVAGQAGTVEEVSLFAVSLATPDNRLIVVPNGNVFGNVIENVSAKPTRRVQITVGVEYTADLDQTRQVLLSTIEGLEGRLNEPAPMVVCAGLGASSVDWHCRVWVESSEFWPMMDKAPVAIKKALDAANIGIPFPQMDIHLDKLDAA